MTQRIQILSKCANVASHATKSHRRRREKMRIPPLGARTRPQRASSPPRILCGAAFESSLDLVFFAEPPQASSAMLGVTLVQCFAVVMIGTYGALSLRLPSTQRCRQAQRCLLQALSDTDPAADLWEPRPIFAYRNVLYIGLRILSPTLFRRPREECVSSPPKIFNSFSGQHVSEPLSEGLNQGLNTSSLIHSTNLLLEL